MSTRPDEIPVKVERVTVEQDKGVSKPSFLWHFVKNVETATDLQSLLVESQLAKQKMEQSGCFKSVDVAIDTTEAYDGAGSATGYQVVYDVKEKKLSISAGGDLSPESMTPEGGVKIGIPNIFGYGEKIQMSFGKDIEASQGEEAPKNLFPNVAINLNYPLIYDKTSIDGEFTSTNRDKPWSNLREESMIGKLGVTHKFNDNLSGTLSVNARQMNLSALTKKDVPVSILEQFGYSSRECLTASVNYDTSKNYIRKVVPSKGFRIKFDADVFKNGYKGFADLAAYQPLSTGVTGVFTASGGYLSTEDVKSRISDRFFIGGNNNIRGFEMNSHGPREAGCALGGDASCQLGVHIYSSLELLGQVFKGISQQLLSPNAAIHAFAVAGNVGDLSSVSQRKHYAYCYGVGVAMSLFQGIPLNLEANILGTSQHKFPKFQAGFSIAI